MINGDGRRVPLIGSPDEWFEWLTGRDDKRAHEATMILGGLEPSDPVPIPPLVQRLDASTEKAQFWAIIALGRLEINALSAAPRLREIARAHEAFGLRQAAILALKRIAPADPATKETLKLGLGDPNPFVRRETLRAFIDVPNLTPADLQLIAAAATDSNEAVAAWSEIALRNIRLQVESGSRRV